MNGHLSFTTDALPERDRFPAFCEAMVRRYAALDMLKPSDGTQFGASMELRRVGGIDIGRIRSSATSFLRSPALVRDGDDDVCTMLALGGGAVQAQGGDDNLLAPGDGVICDNARAGSLCTPSNLDFWMLKCPRPRLAALLPHASKLAGQKLDADPVARRLLFGYLRSAIDLDLGGGGRAVALFDQHIVDLIALALGASGETRMLVEERSVGAIRRAAILRDIDRFLADPDLSPAKIAARLGITPRYLRLLLEETGQSFSEHVLQKRLERADAALRDPGRQSSRIADIAFACGFGDLSYFNRVFRRRYGATPSDIRAAGAPATGSTPR